MNEHDCLSKMVRPNQRTNKHGHQRRGTLQIHITRACNMSCSCCTQGSNYGGKTHFMPVEMFEQACRSLESFWGVVGVFGGNPCVHPEFTAICEVFRKHVPLPQRGLWSNDLMTAEKAEAARATFNPHVSNLNVHMDRKAWDLIKAHWPEANPFGLETDSRHAPVFVAMKDIDRLPVFDEKHTLMGYVENSEEMRHNLISDCDINQNWSALIGMFRGQLRAWFCEIAGAQSMLHQDDLDYPDTGTHLDSHINPDTGTLCRWWELPMSAFAPQIRKHCHECGVPLRGYGELAVSGDQQSEQVSKTHAGFPNLKRRDVPVQVVDCLEQLGVGRLQRTTDYVQNSAR